MDQKQKAWLSLGVVLVLVVISAALFLPLDKKIRKGLDIQGGVSVILTAQPRGGQELTSEVMDRAETIITNRVNGLGVSEASVQRQGQDSLLVQLPGVKDPQSAIEAIGSTGQLEFVDVTTIEDSAAVSALRAFQDDVRLKKGTYTPFMTGEVVTRASAGADQNGKPNVNVEFNSAGTKTWGDYTSTHVGQQVAIVLDGIVQSAPSVREPIRDGKTEISGSFTAEEAKRLAAVLQAGALPVDLKFSDTRVVGPTLGADALQAGILAALIGLGLVAVYMAVVYRLLGVTTWLALVVFATFFLGALALLSMAGAFALTLPGIAGIVLTIGMAADSSILVVERLKEEVGMGKTLRSAALSSTRHAFGTSVDADLVTLVTAIVLFFVAIGPVKGFALTLMIGIAIDLFTVWFFKRPLVILMADTIMVKMPWLFSLKGGGQGV